MVVFWPIQRIYQFIFRIHVPTLDERVSSFHCSCLDFSRILEEKSKLDSRLHHPDILIVDRTLSTLPIIAGITVGMVFINSCNILFFLIVFLLLFNNNLYYFAFECLSLGNWADWVMKWILGWDLDSSRHYLEANCVKVNSFIYLGNTLLNCLFYGGGGRCAYLIPEIL